MTALTDTSITGIVFDIKKFAIHDGPGIRTTVFMKGCPLRCLWCHNPESVEAQPEISFLPDKCIGCGYCLRACPHHLHRSDGTGRHFDREKCQRCGLCTRECYPQALELIGKPMTVSEALAEVLKDKAFYETSGGGMTISGGEPMFQFEFTQALLAAAKEQQLHNCLDTSGFAPYERYRQLYDTVDLWLYDYKETDPQRHEQFTGVPRAPIVENLRRLDADGCAIVLRCPIIPGLNDRTDHFAGIAQLADSLTHVREINIEPYHPLGKSKSQRLGKTFELAELSYPDDADVAAWEEAVRSQTRVPVIKS